MLGTGHHDGNRFASYIFPEDAPPRQDRIKQIGSIRVFIQCLGHSLRSRVMGENVELSVGHQPVVKIPVKLLFTHRQFRQTALYPTDQPGPFTPLQQTDVNTSGGQTQLFGHPAVAPPGFRHGTERFHKALRSSERFCDRIQQRFSFSDSVTGTPLDRVSLALFSGTAPIPDAPSFTAPSPIRRPAAWFSSG